MHDEHEGAFEVPNWTDLPPEVQYPVIHELRARLTELLSQNAELAQVENASRLKGELGGDGGIHAASREHLHRSIAAYASALKSLGA